MVSHPSCLHSGAEQRSTWAPMDQVLMSCIVISFLQASLGVLQCSQGATSALPILQLLDKALAEFQIHVNRVNILELLAHESAVVTATYFQSSLPSFVTECTAESQSACFCSAFITHADVSRWTRGCEECMEELLLLYNAGRAPPKLGRREEHQRRVYSQYLQHNTNTPERVVALQHFAGCIDAEGLLGDTRMSSLLERYVLFAAPPVNPYQMPEPHVRVPAEACDVAGKPLSDMAGFLTERLPAPSPSLFQFMTKCWSFVGRANRSILVSAGALCKARCIGAACWRVADSLGPENAGIAAELRAAQRMVVVLAVGQLALDVGFGTVPADATALTRGVCAMHICRACRLLALTAASKVCLRDGSTLFPCMGAATHDEVPDFLLAACIAPNHWSGLCGGIGLQLIDHKCRGVPAITPIDDEEPDDRNGEEQGTLAVDVDAAGLPASARKRPATDGLSAWPQDLKRSHAAPAGLCGTGGSGSHDAKAVHCLDLDADEEGALLDAIKAGLV